MISSDKNIETISQLAEEAKHYFELQSEYVKLDVIEKLVKLITWAAIAIVTLLLLGFILIHLSFALAYALMPLLGSVGSFCAVAGIHLLLLIIFIAKRHSWIEKPLVKFLANLLLNN